MRRKTTLAAAVLAILLAAGIPLLLRAGSEEPIRVGVLFSQTGDMAKSERPLIDAARLAVEEINRKGGLLGRQVETVVADGRSEPAEFARQAEVLIRGRKVAAVFGCWTSRTRKTVRPIFEKHGHLLFYPLQYEGLEESPNLVYLGLSANQQLLPALKWTMGTFGRRLFLVGSDYVFPRAANEILREQARRWRGTIVGEEYVPVSSQDVGAIVRKIVEARPDAILNTLNGDINLAFFRELRRQGIQPAEIPTISFSVAESQLAGGVAEDFVGDYAVWSYFQSLPTPENRRFVRAFQVRFGAGRVTDDPIISTYSAVHLWADAVRQAGTADTAVIAREVVGRSLITPAGMLYVDAESRHTWQPVRIGRIRRNGQFDIVWDSRKPIRPVPYPAFRSRQAWESYLDDLRQGWGGEWFNPRPLPLPAATRTPPR